MTENADSSGLVELDWSGANSLSVEHANVFVIQAGAEGHILSLGFAAPPVIAGVQEEPLTSMQVRPITRVFLTPQAAASLVSGLVANIQKREDIHGGAKAGDAQEAGDES